MAVVAPTGIGLIGALVSACIIGIAIFILRKYKPQVKLVLYGTIGVAFIVLFHILTTTSTNDAYFMNAPEFVALLICILAQLLWIAINPKLIN